MPEWMNWMSLAVIAFVVGLGIGIILSGPDTWTPGERRDDEQTLHD